MAAPGTIFDLAAQARAPVLDRVFAFHLAAARCTAGPALQAKYGAALPPRLRTEPPTLAAHRTPACSPLHESARPAVRSYCATCVCNLADVSQLVLDEPASLERQEAKDKPTFEVSEGRAPSSTTAWVAGLRRDDCQSVLSVTDRLSGQQVNPGRMHSPVVGSLGDVKSRTPNCTTKWS